MKNLMKLLLLLIIFLGTMLSFAFFVEKATAEVQAEAPWLCLVKRFESVTACDNNGKITSVGRYCYTRKDNQNVCKDKYIVSCSQCSSQSICRASVDSNSNVCVIPTPTPTPTPECALTCNGTCWEQLSVDALQCNCGAHCVGQSSSAQCNDCTIPTPTPISLPDLKPQNLQVTRSGQSTYQASFSVQNTGNVVSGAGSTVGILSNDNKIIGSIVLDRLQPGESKSYKITLNIPQINSSSYLQVYIDPDGKLPVSRRDHLTSPKVDLFPIPILTPTSIPTPKFVWNKIAVCTAPASASTPFSCQDNALYSYYCYTTDTWKDNNGCATGWSKASENPNTTCRSNETCCYKGRPVAATPTPTPTTCQSDTDCSTGKTCVGSPSTNYTVCLTKNVGNNGAYCGKPNNGGPNSNACTSDYCNPTTLLCANRPNCGNKICSSNQTCVGTSYDTSTYCLTKDRGGIGSYCGDTAKSPNNEACSSGFCDSTTLLCSNPPKAQAPTPTTTPIPTITSAITDFDSCYNQCKGEEGSLRDLKCQITCNNKFPPTPTPTLPPKVTIPTLTPKPDPTSTPTPVTQKQCVEFSYFNNLLTAYKAGSTPDTKLLPYVNLDSNGKIEFSSFDKLLNAYKQNPCS